MSCLSPTIPSCGVPVSWGSEESVTVTLTTNTLTLSPPPPVYHHLLQPPHTLPPLSLTCTLFTCTLTDRHAVWPSRGAVTHAAQHHRSSLHAQPAVPLCLRCVLPCQTSHTATHPPSNTPQTTDCDPHGKCLHRHTILQALSTHYLSQILLMCSRFSGKYGQHVISRGEIQPLKHVVPAGPASRPPSKQ